MSLRKEHFVGPLLAAGTVALAIFLFFIFGGFRQNTPSPPVQTNEPISYQDAVYDDVKITPERQQYIASLCAQSDLTPSQINDLIDKYDDAHRTNPLTQEQRRIRSEDRAKALAGDQSGPETTSTNRPITPGSPQEAEVKDRVRKWYKEHHLKDDGTPE